MSALTVVLIVAYVVAFFVTGRLLVMYSKWIMGTDDLYDLEKIQMFMAALLWPLTALFALVYGIYIMVWKIFTIGLKR